MHLETVRQTYEIVLTGWPRWRDFGKIVEQELGFGATHIAWTNLAKCRLSIDRNPAGVTELCQRQSPIQQTVEAIRPVVVLSCVLNARPGGGLIRSWRTASADPWV